MAPCRTCVQTPLKWAPRSSVPSNGSRVGRPIHWIVSLLGSEVVRFEFAGVQSGRATRGHRFLAPESFDLDEAGDYENALEAAHVIVDLKRRKDRMMEGLLASAQSLGGVLEPDAFLAD